MGRIIRDNKSKEKIVSQKVKALCTGSKGFIGSKLVERLKREGLSVQGFDMADGVDLRNAEDVDYAVRGKDVVFHLAAVADLNQSRVKPIETMKINVEGTWNVANSCSRHGVKLYFASTMCTYGNQKVHPVTEETLPNPSEIYACSKLAGENVIKGFHYTYGLQYVMMRFATIYGEGTRPALGTHIFLRQALNGEPITVHGDGSQTRTLTYITDLIDAIMAAYDSGKMNETWNMTTEEEVSALKMAEDIKKLTGSKSEIVFIPQRVGQTMRESVSAEKIRRECAWAAKVGWGEGVARMYEWFKNTGQKKNVYTLPK